ncbi:hypothetical protein Hanom_Chr15g01405331 [Helianthus anomalus]
MVVFNYLCSMFKVKNVFIFIFTSNVCLRSLLFVCVRDQCSRTVREQLNFLNERTQTWPCLCSFGSITALQNTCRQS